MSGRKVIIPNEADMSVLKFEPKDDMMLAKSRFWMSIKDNPMLDPENLTISDICRMSGTNSVKSWLSKPEFRGWFFNQNLAKQKIQAAAELAVDALIGIVTQCPEPKTMSAQVKAATILLEYGGYAPPKNKVVVYRDKEIGEMGEEELREFIKSGTKKLGEGEDT